ncbi:hypothetical protein FGE12_07725 [Aggregicoccus sp. 17bor-14]|uniref:hypothetical protein n=1 Tax=Myxococcaceae TaxID=31 RepID=UPI00129C5E03|nr:MULTISPECIES: hypothetical protein [Myxococcaceae]MBF5042284.1 hypothetical protein [Simulacricoccus sp. 17bor-14]MRI88058.1 hypothetical protein [Aggregicoccus sp. 17bor-14]
MISIERFTGGSKAMLVSGVIGLAGLLLTAVGFFMNPQATMFSYLLAFAYWCGIAVASIILLCIFHTAKAKWPTVVRRALETQGVSVGVFAVLILPIIFVGMKYLYPWHTTPDTYNAEELHQLAHKQHGYLNMPFFIARQVIYFLVWIFVSNRLFGWSTRQDETGELELTNKARRLGPGSLPFLGLTITFAGFDWLMSLTPLWQSTIYGAYYFAGSFLAAFAVLTIATVNARGDNLYGNLVTTHHLHNLGKFLLAFVAFWAYIGFSQALLVWIANLPEEAAWYSVRIFGGWRPMSIALFFGHFVIPFFVLLSRDIKLQPRPLAVIATYILVIHFIDLYWLVWPAYSAGSPTFHFTLVTAFAGVGGLSVAYGLFRFRGQYSLPVKDPYIADSLRYVQP